MTPISNSPGTTGFPSICQTGVALACMLAILLGGCGEDASAPAPSRPAPTPAPAPPAAPIQPAPIQPTAAPEAPTLPGLARQLTCIPSFSACSIYLTHAGDPAACRLAFRPRGGAWSPAFAPVKIARSTIESEAMFRGSIVHLDEATAYEVQADLLDGAGTVVGHAEGAFTTWASQVPIGRTERLDGRAAGQLSIVNVHGTPDAWIRYTFTGSPSTIDGGTAADAAITVRKCSYVLIEGITVRGGARHGIIVQESQNVRVANCDIAGFGRVGVQDFAKGGKFYTKDGKVIDHDAGVFIARSSNLVVERCYMHDPRSTANAWSLSHPSGPTGVFVDSAGGITLRYNAFIGSNAHRWNDGVEGSDNELPTIGGFTRDSDIYGNMFAFGNDDGIELDGGQMNVRCVGNRFEGFFCGVSTTPNRRGPSYVMRNLILELGDEEGLSDSVFKNGGGTTYSQGRNLFLHNTVVAKGEGISGVGYGKDGNRAFFHGFSRNNVLCVSLHPINDRERAPGNDFDFDLLSNRSDDRDLVVAHDGAERHAVIGQPTFADLAHGDARLASGSRGIDAGAPVDNLAGPISGKAPDMGAFETGIDRPIPYRSMPVRIDLQRLDVECEVASGRVERRNLALSVLPGATWRGSFRVCINSATPWLRAEPDHGEVAAGSPTRVAIVVDPARLPGAGLHPGVVLFRFADGSFVPVTVYVRAYSGARAYRLPLKEFSGTGPFTADEGMILDSKVKSGITCQVDIEADGAYYLFARIRCPAPLGMHDSFFLGLDDAEPKQLNLRAAATWEWSPLPVNPEKGGIRHQVQLKKGIHHIVIRPRESLSFDGLLISPDPIPRD